MLDIDAVAADVVGRSGLGRDADAEDEDPDAGADEEGVSELMLPSRSPVVLHVEWIEVTAYDDSEEVDDDAFASSSEESDAAEEVAAARIDLSIGRALCQIAVLELGKRSYCTRKGSRCERTGPGRPQRMRTQVK
jgi:hypothetical protein